MNLDFSEFQNVINTRKQVFSSYNVTELEYVLNRLADGESIDPFRLRTAKLRELLVILPEIETAISKVSADIETSLTNRGYSFIIGDYGTGKTQLREILIDECSKKLPNLVTKKTDLALASFASFSLDLAQEIKNFTHNKYPDTYEYIIDDLNILLKSKEDSEIYRHLINIIKILSKNEIIIFLNFDEVDMVPNFNAFTSWANFIVMVNQHIEAGIHIAFYMAPRDVNRLWEKDERLTRFNRYINNAIMPGKTFEDQVHVAIAQIVAMFEIVNQRTISEGNKYIMFLFYKLYYNRLKKLSVRKINTDFFQITEFLANLDSKDSWKKLLPYIKELNNSHTQSFELGFSEVLSELLIEFELFDDNYRLTYDKGENELIIERELDQNYITLVKIPCIIAYAKGNNYDPKVLQFKFLGNEKPTLLITIGETLSTEEQKLLLTEFTAEKRKEIQILTTNAKLATPLLLYSFESTKDDYTLKRQLAFWFDLISDSKNVFRVYGENLVRSYYESDLENQLIELRREFNLPVKERAVSGLSATSSRRDMGDQTSLVGDLTETEIEILLRILVIYQNRIAKKKENVIKEVGEDLRKNEITNVTDNQINAIALRLVQRDFLKETTSQFRKTEFWDPKEIVKSFNLI